MNMSNGAKNFIKDQEVAGVKDAEMLRRQDAI